MSGSDRRKGRIVREESDKHAEDRLEMWQESEAGGDQEENLEMWQESEAGGDQEENLEMWQESEPAGDRKKNQESAWKIMEALSGVDTMLLERSDTVIRRKKPVWQYGRAWAAVVCVAVVGILTWRSYQFMTGADMSGSQASGGSAGDGMQMPIAAVNDTNTNTNTNTNSNGGVETELFTEDANAMEEKEMFSGHGCENQGSTSPSVSPNGSGNQEGISLSGVPGGSMSQEGTFPSAVPGESGKQEGVGSAVTGGVENQDGDIMIDQVCGIKPVECKKLTEEEARNWEILGEYIPDGIPKGYRFESSYWYEEMQKLTILWRKGLDDIQLSITSTEHCDTVDIDRTETYDARLYEIPYGETVPQEYRMVFDDPIFAWEDFSTEIIESRMRSYEDRGDTNTPRGNFGILFPDGVLMRFRGRGTAEQIWEMFQTLGL